MIRGSLAKRYARALMAIGQDKGIYELLGSELRQMALLAQEDETLKMIIGAPVVSKEVREKVIEAIGQAVGMNEVSVRFLKLLNVKGRLPYLNQISEAYQEMIDQAQGRVRADVISAAPLSEAAQAKLKQALSGLTGKEVIMKLDVDNELLGGVVTRVAGKLFDGSVRTQLKAVEERLKATVRA